MLLNPQKLNTIAHELEMMGCDEIAKAVRNIEPDILYPKEWLRLLSKIANDKRHILNKHQEPAGIWYVKVERETDAAKFRSAIYYAYRLAQKICKETPQRGWSYEKGYGCSNQL